MLNSKLERVHASGQIVENRRTNLSNRLYRHE